jgi:hypothetical protein
MDDAVPAHVATIGAGAVAATATGGLTLAGAVSVSGRGRVTASGGVVDEIAVATAPEELMRRAGESPDDFYRRIARAHRALSKGTKRPTMELGRKAGVRVGTAAAWVNRARARGLYEEEGEQT